MKVNGMTLIDYQSEAYKAIQPHANDREEVLHWIIGLAEEVGEVASLVKHRYFHNEELPEEKFVEELGDVLWYLAAMCTALGISFEDVAVANIAKLGKRFGGSYSDEAVSMRHQSDEEVSKFIGRLLDNKTGGKK